ncbi:hypothetical protein GF362_04270 [Candidatus Dojkabacteria bacterium]|nr:hypothetical protein [Candidatus Dojkabacteria bacterium]
MEIISRDTQEKVNWGNTAKNLLALAGGLGLAGLAIDGLDGHIDTVDITNFRHYKDTDGDGLSDELENQLGTDFLDPDTNNDGLTDWQNLNDGGNPFNYYKDEVKNELSDEDMDNLPNMDGDDDWDGIDEDVDGDLIVNTLELQDWGEGMMLGTDPLNPDTDGDGLTDGEEVEPVNIEGGLYTGVRPYDMDGDAVIGPRDPGEQENHNP